MKFEELVDHGPEKSWFNFGTDPKHILDITNIITSRVGQQYITIQNAKKFPMTPLLSLSFSNCK